MPNGKQGVFEGYRTVFGNCRVDFEGQELNPRLDLFYHSRDGFDWGYMGAGALQLAFAVLVTVGDEKIARKMKAEFAKEVIARFDKKEWQLTVSDIEEWLQRHNVKTAVPSEASASPEDNVVKSVCKELGITQKKLAEILEIPEGTVSSWAVKNEIPRLGKKAIEFYIRMQKNEAVVKRFKELITLVSES